MTSTRIASAPRHPIDFTFDGKPLTGRAGDTIAAALLANDVAIVGRSFKYHRPRGIFGHWSEEPNAIVDVTLGGRTTPNMRATTEPLVEGMAIRSVNSAPDAAGDRFALLDRLAPFLPAGFYYKTFIWPDWHLFQPRIRAMAGLGRIDPEHRPFADVPHETLHCDLLVIGAGPAGLAAARAASADGRRVVLLDDRAQPGGSLAFRPAMIDGKDGMGWAADTVERLRHAGQTYLPRTTAYGIYDHRLVMAWQRAEEGVDRLWQIRARHIVLAAGAIERPLVFPDNDRPGIMSAEAALAYLALHDVLVGRRIVLAAANTVTLAAADRLRAAGAKVTVADLRDGTTLDAVHGKRRVEAVTLSGRKVDADCLLVSGGFTPSVHLHCQAGGKLRYDEEIAAFVPADQVEGLAVTGAAAGQFDLAAALQSGHAIGGGAGRIPQAGAEAAAYAVTPSWPRPASPGRQWIDYQNDVTLKDIELAARENFRSVEHLKRYTTLGMATDQGKTSNMNGLAAMAAVTGNSIPQTGTTTYRPPFVPVPFTVVAGRRRAHLFNPVRRLELEDEHKRLGAVFREYGGWLRPAWYGAGRAGDEIAREARMARETVGILDGSPLGKIEVMGPGAGALVDFNSYNRLSNLAPGRFRYGFMLTEAGIVYDDGVTAKLSDDHYLISCSSGHVAGVAMRLEEFRQDRFDPARVFVHNSTPHWATLTATGPASRDIVAALGLGVELADDALPHMSLRDCTFDGTVARIARVSFTGDRSYEVSVPQSKAAALYRAMLEAARRVRGGPLGSEALLLLRAEKGYIIAGKDTDGTTMPQDLGITGPRDKRADEFVGKRSLSTENALRSDRLQTVGLTVPDGADALPTGAHIVEEAAGRRRSAGFVTSSYVSPLLGRPIALALVERGLSRIGEEVQLFHLGRRLSARIAPACALDPDGSRLNG